MVSPDFGGMDMKRDFFHNIPEGTALVSMDNWEHIGLLKSTNN
jgi:hypothetical protein